MLGILISLFWPIAWVIDRIKSLFDLIQMPELGVWSPYGTPLSVVVIAIAGVVRFVGVVVQMPLWGIAIVYAVGVLCEWQNYSSNAKTSVESESPLFPFVFVQTIVVGLFVLMF